MPTTATQLTFIDLADLRHTLDDPAAAGTRTITDGPEPDLTDYDLIVAGLSGKDAHAMLDVLTTRARRAGVLDRVITMHADMGLMEWPSVHFGGTYFPSNREHVAHLAQLYGIPPERHIETRRVVTEPDGTVRPQSLIEQVAAWGMFPDPARRWCTSDFKVKKIQAALTPLVKHYLPLLGRPVRILNVTGMRGDESTRRAALPNYAVGYANSHRHQDEYLPIHHLSTAEVRATVDASAAGHHWAYDSQPGAGDWCGMSRLSCATCIMSNKADLILAARRRPRLAALVAEVESRLGHQFKLGMPMSTILRWAAEPGGPQPGVVLQEDTAEFDELEANVRSQLTATVKLRASTTFTAVPTHCLARIAA